MGVEVTPRSIKHDASGFFDLDCTIESPQDLPDVAVGGRFILTYTYSVKFEFSEIKWASRWDPYLKSGEGRKVHWFAIVNSLVLLCRLPISLVQGVALHHTPITLVQGQALHHTPITLVQGVALHHIPITLVQGLALHHTPITLASLS